MIRKIITIIPPLKKPKSKPKILFISLKIEVSIKYEILYVTKEMAIRASVKPKRKESIIINSQLSPKILIMNSISDIDTNIRGETK